MPSTQSSSFTTWQINRTTFAVREDDAFEEHPLIYVKVHQKAPMLVLSDTGTDEASESHQNGMSSHQIDSAAPQRCDVTLQIGANTVIYPPPRGNPAILLPIISSIDLCLCMKGLL